MIQIISLAYWLFDIILIDIDDDFHYAGQLILAPLFRLLSLLLILLFRRH